MIQEPFHIIYQITKALFIAWAWMAAGGIKSLVFIDVTADRTSGMKCGVHRPLPSAHIS